MYKSVLHLMPMNFDLLSSYLASIEWRCDVDYFVKNKQDKFVFCKNAYRNFKPNNKAELYVKET